MGPCMKFHELSSERAIYVRIRTYVAASDWLLSGNYPALRTVSRCQLMISKGNGPSVNFAPCRLKELHVPSGRGLSRQWHA